MSKDAVKVAVRCRPLSSKEKAERAKNCLRYPQEGQVVIGRSHAFTYDYVFEEAVDQQGVYDACVRDLVNKFIKGFNATILAYGQTGSGKTYTMGTASSHNVAYNSLGIVPRVVEHVFTTIEETMSKGSDVRYEVKVQFLEIYNDSINDLLNPQEGKSDLSIRETKGGISVLGAIEEAVKCPEDMLDSLDRGTACRVTGSTAMNATSSRSHAIFSMILVQTKQVELNDKADVRQDTMVSKFHFVDLAGSERVKRTGATGERMKEGININKGLLALGNVISALGDEKRKAAHVPFRDAKITRLLQDSLGGNSKTLMIACCSPSDTNFDETLNTLKYANRARNIKNKPIINRDPMAAKMEAMSKRIKQLEAIVAGEGKSLGGGVDSEAHEEIMNQLLNTEMEVKRLNRRLESTRQNLSQMRDRVVTLETERDRYRLKHDNLKTKVQEKHPDLLSEQDQKDDEESAKEQKEMTIIGQLRRKIMDLESKLDTDPLTVMRSKSSRSLLAKSSERRISLGGVSTTNLDDDDDDDDDDEEVEIETPFGVGTLVVSRDDGILEVYVGFGTIYMRDRVTTPFGNGPVLSRTPKDSESSEPSAVTVLIGTQEVTVPLDVCASLIVPPDDDDDDDDDVKTTIRHHKNESILTANPGAMRRFSALGGNLSEQESMDELERQKERLEKLGALTSEVRNLDEDIEKKELLMKRLIETQNRARMEEKNFKSKISSLEDEVDRIRAERDKALKDISGQLASKNDGAGATSTRNKLVDKYRSKLKKLEDSLNDLRRKYAENQKLLKTKSKAADKLKRLQGEIALHKQQRVNLQKKMKEAGESHRNWIKQTRKDLKRARKERNKAKIKVTKLQTKVNKQAAIIKRREDEKEMLKRRLQMFENKARAGRQRRNQRRRGKKGKKGKEPKGLVTTFSNGLEYELGEAVAKTDLTQRLNAKLAKQRETKTQIAHNNRRLASLQKGSFEYFEAMEEADTLSSRKAMIDDQIVSLRTALATWTSKTDHPGNLNKNLFKRHPELGAPELQEVLLQLMTKIVRQELRSKTQERMVDQLESQLAEAQTQGGSLAPADPPTGTGSGARGAGATTTRRKEMQPPPPRKSGAAGEKKKGGFDPLATVVRIGGKFSLKQWSQEARKSRASSVEDPFSLNLSQHLDFERLHGKGGRRASGRRSLEIDQPGGAVPPNRSAPRRPQSPRHSGRKGGKRASSRTRGTSRTRASSRTRGSSRTRNPSPLPGAVAGGGGGGPRNAHLPGPSSRRRSWVKTSFGTSGRSLPWDPEPARPHTPTHRPLTPNWGGSITPRRSMTPRGSRTNSDPDGRINIQSWQERFLDGVGVGVGVGAGVGAGQDDAEDDGSMGHSDPLMQVIGKKKHLKGGTPTLTHRKGRSPNPFNADELKRPQSAHGYSPAGVMRKHVSVFDRLTDHSTFTGTHRNKTRNTRGKRTDRVTSSSHGAISAGKAGVEGSGSSHVKGSSSRDSTNSNVFDRLTDRSNFTGMYKNRFSDTSGLNSGGGGGGHPGATTTTAAELMAMHQNAAAGSSSSDAPLRRMRSGSRTRSVVENMQGSQGKNDVFSRLTDKKAYTGMYRVREELSQQQQQQQSDPSAQTAQKPDRERRNSATGNEVSSRRNSADTPKITPQPPKKTPTFSVLSDQFNQLADEFNTNSVFQKKKQGAEVDGAAAAVGAGGGGGGAGGAMPNSATPLPSAAPNTPSATATATATAGGAPDTPNPSSSATPDHHPAPNGPASSSSHTKTTSVFDRLTDTKGYTGMYRLRRNKADPKTKGRKGNSRQPAGVKKQPQQPGTTSSPASGEKNKDNLTSSMLEEELGSLMQKANNMAPTAKGPPKAGLSVFDRLAGPSRAKGSRTRSVSPTGRSPNK